MIKMKLILAAVSMAMMACACASSRDDGVLPVGFDVEHPRLACTPAERQRLRAALLEGAGARYAAVAARIRRADQALGQPPDFPPRGGRHNQWYQCDDCQAPLRPSDHDGAHVCRICEREYSGPPYDDVVFRSRHNANLRRMLDCAWAYALTDNPDYAAYARDVLTGYARRYRGYPRRGTSARNLPYNFVTGGRLYDQTLCEAFAIATTIAPAYDLIHDAALMQPEDHRAIREDLIRPMLDNIARNWWNTGICNWRSWHNAAMLWGGVMLRDQAWIDRSIRHPRSGYEFQLAHGVDQDGMWHEGSWGYHFYALKALTLQAEGARRVGLDLWSHPRLRAMYILPVYYRMPDGGLPRFGDATGGRLFADAQLVEAGFFNLQARHLREFLPPAPVWETVLYGRDLLDEEAGTDAPVLDSRVFQKAGHVILRTAGEAGLTAAMTFGPYGGYHGHLDKLSFVFYAHGRELAVDPGRAASQAYRLPVHRRWYKSTLSHNTVMVNGRPQRPCTGRLEWFHAGDRLAIAVVAAEPWRNVLHRRMLLMTDQYLLVADIVTAGARSTFDWLYHQRAARAVSAAATAPAAPPEGLAGGEYIDDLRHGAFVEHAAVAFEDDGLPAALLLRVDGPAGLYLGDGPGRSLQDRVPMVMVRQTGRRAVYAALLEPVLPGNARFVAGLELEDAGQDGLRIKLDGAAGIKRIEWTPAGVTVD